MLNATAPDCGNQRVVFGGVVGVFTALLAVLSGIAGWYLIARAPRTNRVQTGAPVPPPS
jgi:hypothetical protein